MTSNLGEWVVRTVMLVLAGLVTLSILGSIAAMSNEAGVPGLVRDRARPLPAPEPQPQSETLPQPSSNSAAAAEESGSGQGTELITVPAPPEEERPERWLEAIA